MTAKQINQNDFSPSFSQPYYNFFVAENKLHSNAIVGQVKVTDGDSQDQVKLSLKGPFASYFTINDQGILRIRSLNGINSTQCYLSLEAVDNGSPPRSSTAQVTVQLPASSLMIFSNAANDLDSDRQELNEPAVQDGSHLLDMNSLMNAGSSSSALILVIVLGVLLATLFIIIITLTIHLLKQKRFADPMCSSGSAGSACSQRSGSHSPDAQLSFQHQLFTSSPNGFDTQLLTNSNTIQRLSASSNNRLGTLLPAGLDNPMFANSNQQPKTQFKTMELDSAIHSASDISSNEGTSSHSNHHRNGSNPPPPPNLTASSNGNGLVWSHNQNGSIPRRIKRLTWEGKVL